MKTLNISATRKFFKINPDPNRTAGSKTEGAPQRAADHGPDHPAQLGLAGHRQEDPQPRRSQSPHSRHYGGVWIIINYSTFFFFPFSSLFLKTERLRDSGASPGRSFLEKVWNKKANSSRSTKFTNEFIFNRVRKKKRKRGKRKTFLLGEFSWFYVKKSRMFAFSKILFNFLFVEDTISPQSRIAEICSSNVSIFTSKFSNQISKQEFANIPTTGSASLAWAASLVVHGPPL